MHFSLSLAAAALLGTASALPGDWAAFYGSPSGPRAPWGTGSVSSSSATGSLPTAPAGSGSVGSSSTVPTETIIDKSSGWLSSTAPYGSGSYKPYPTGGNPDKPAGTGVLPGTVTEMAKIYTTTTVCPVTTTQWAHNTSIVITTLTTSTITVTSCPGGCHGATSSPATLPLPKPTAPSGSETGTMTATYPTTVVSTITSFVPCSTAVSSNSETTFYSTWLTVSYLTTTYETVTTSCYTLYPSSTPAATTTEVPAGETTPGGPDTFAPTSTEEPGSDATTLPPTTVTGKPTGSCPAAQTVYSTVVSYITIYAGGDNSRTADAGPWGYPIKPSSTLSWSVSGTTSGHAQPTGGNAKPSNYAKPTGY